MLMRCPWGFGQVLLDYFRQQVPGFNEVTQFISGKLHGCDIQALLDARMRSVQSCLDFLDVGHALTLKP